jgi:hypothetical protein
MQWRFCLWNIPVQPMVKLGVEVHRAFTITSIALSERFDPALKFGISPGSVLQLSNECQHLSQLVLVQFLIEQCLLATFVLKRPLAAFTAFFAASIHLDFPLATHARHEVIVTNGDAMHASRIVSHGNGGTVARP